MHVVELAADRQLHLRAHPRFAAPRHGGGVDRPLYHRVAHTCPKRLVIEARWKSKALTFAVKLQPQRLIK